MRALAFLLLLVSTSVSSSLPEPEALVRRITSEVLAEL